MIVAAMPHGGRNDAAEKIQVAQMVRVTIVHKATPTPRPAPRPTPKPLPIVTPRPVVAVAATPAPAAPKSKAGLAKSIAKTHYHSKRIVQHVAVAPKHAQGPGLGAAGSGRGKFGIAGTGTGQGGAGNGTGTGGNGNGIGNYAGVGEPCGFVEFTNINGAQYDKSTGGFYHDIRMVVHLGGGGIQGTVLDWRWYFASEAADPWSSQNLSNQDFPTLFQFPPADKKPNEPPVVQYVISHSTPDGRTTLKDCRGM